MSLGGTMWQIIDSKTKEVVATDLTYKETFKVMREYLKQGKKVHRHWVDV
jgi:hypothetical protein